MHPKTNQKLTPEQLHALELYIKRLDTLGQPPLLPMWRSAAEFIWKKSSPPGTILKPLSVMAPTSMLWVYRETKALA